jgi:hypothetical protein
VGLHDEPQEIRVDRQGAPVWYFDEDLLEVQVDSFSTVEITLKSISSDRTLPKRPW